MSAIQETNWKTLFFELVIVFIGLLAALQVDEYRDRRAFEAAQQLGRVGDGIEDPGRAGAQAIGA